MVTTEKEAGGEVRSRDATDANQLALLTLAHAPSSPPLSISFSLFFSPPEVRWSHRVGAVIRLFKASLYLLSFSLRAPTFFFFALVCYCACFVTGCCPANPLSCGGRRSLPLGSSPPAELNLYLSSCCLSLHSFYSPYRPVQLGRRVLKPFFPPFFCFRRVFCP